LGRFLQREVNGTAIPVVIATSINGETPDAFLAAFDAHALYSDGMNLYLFGLANPVVFQDPTGLSAAAWLAEYFLELTGGQRAGWGDDDAFLSKLSIGFGLAGLGLLGGAIIIAEAPAIVAAAQSFQMWVATAGSGVGAALLPRLGNVITRFNIDKLLRNPRKLEHIFQPKHMNDLLGSRIEAIDKVVKYLFDLDARGGLPQGVFNLPARIDGLLMKVQGNVMNGELLIGDFWVLP